MKSLIKTSMLLFLFSFFIGPIGDIYHVFTKTTGYPNHYAFYVFGIPWWVYPFFGFSGLSIGLGFHFNEKLIFKTDIKRYGEQNLLRASIGPIIFVLSYLLSGHLTLQNTGPLINNIILGSITIAFWYLFDRSYRSALMAIVLASIGILVECSLVSLNVFWYYPNDNLLFGVASWLPWLYMILAIGLGNITNFLMKSFK